MTTPLSTEQHLQNLVEAAEAHLSTFKRPPFASMAQTRYDGLMQAKEQAAAHLQSLKTDTEPLE